MIFVTHGVIEHWRDDRISHGLLLSKTAFEEHLQEVNNKYVSLEEEREGGGHALTVDDATYGGYRAVCMARRWGHEVSWFVNGMNVQSGVSYFPFQLSWMLDETRRHSCFFDDRHWDLTSLGDRRELRLLLKHCYMRLQSCAQIQELVARCSEFLEVDPSGMERPLKTVTEQELRKAAQSGAALRNHGWSHINPQLLSKGELFADVEKNERYLEQFQRPRDPIYAPPFGRRFNCNLGLTYTLLADRTLACGERSAAFANRCDLKLMPTSQASSHAVLSELSLALQSI